MENEAISYMNEIKSEPHKQNDLEPTITKSSGDNFFQHYFPENFLGIYYKAFELFTIFFR